MRNDSHLTVGYKPVFARRIGRTRVGMASWAAQGPFGTTCGQCAHFGYYQQIRNIAGNVVNTKFRRGCCAMFHRLTGQHGAAISPGTESCRYFRRREQENAR